MKTLESKKHHKNNYLFANNLFPNVYYIVRTLKEPKCSRAEETSFCFFMPVFCIFHDCLYTIVL